MFLTVPCTDAAFPRCVEMPKRWNKWLVALLSPVMSAILDPISLMNLRPIGAIGPSVSNAIGIIMYFADRHSYFDSFPFSAFKAALPASWLVESIWLGATVSVQVTSHTRLLPLDHAVVIRPSGLLPSFLCKPVGSLLAEMCAEPRASFIIWLHSLCRGCLPSAPLQLKPWRPDSSTSFPH